MPDDLSKRLLSARDDLVQWIRRGGPDGYEKLDALNAVIEEAAAIIGRAAVPVVGNLTDEQVNTMLRECLKPGKVQIVRG